MLVGLVAVIGVIAAPISGRLSSGVARRGALLGGMAGASLALAIAPAASGPAAQLGTAILLGLGLGISQPTLLFEFNRLVPGEVRGLAVGVRTSVARASQVGIPLGLGLVTGALSLSTGLIILGCCGILATGALARSLVRSV